MSKWLSLFCCSMTLNAFSQHDPVDFTAIDQRVQSVKATSPPILTKELVAFCQTDLEKVRSIFRWITDNIAYKTKQVIVRGQITGIVEDTVSRSLDERVAMMVLQRGSASCDGYARLFKTLCSYAGIRSEIIAGYARGNKSIRQFGNNHTWNAVMIDNGWQLLDVAWASGFVTRMGDIFIRQFDEEYFLTPPERFILDHYPDDLAWTLMAEPPLMPEFKNSPFKQRTFGKYRITAYWPTVGIIEASEGDTLNLELQTSDAARDSEIGAETFQDMSRFSMPSAVLLSPRSVGLNTVSYTYHVNSAVVQWLYIQYNHDVVMRYRLIVKDKPVLRETASR